MGKINISPIKASDLVLLLRAWDLYVWAALLWRPVVMEETCQIPSTKMVCINSHLQTTTPPSTPSLSRLYWTPINLLFRRHGVWCWQERLSNTGSWEDLGRSRDEKSKCPTMKGLRVSPQYVIIQCTSLKSTHKAGGEHSHRLSSHSYEHGSKLCPPLSILALGWGQAAQCPAFS